MTSTTINSVDTLLRKRFDDRRRLLKEQTLESQLEKMQRDHQELRALADSYVIQIDEETKKAQAAHNKLESDYNSKRWLSLGCLTKVIRGIQHAGHAAPEHILLEKLQPPVLGSPSNQEAINLLRDAGLVKIKWFCEILSELIPRPIAPSDKIFLTEEGSIYIQSLKQTS